MSAGNRHPLTASSAKLYTTKLRRKKKLKLSTNSTQSVQDKRSGRAGRKKKKKSDHAFRGAPRRNSRRPPSAPPSSLGPGLRPFFDQLFALAVRVSARPMQGKRFDKSMRRCSSYKKNAPSNACTRKEVFAYFCML